jgi:hypothetical protein
MRQVRVQGCLPTLVVFAAIVALGALAFTAGLAVMAGTAVFLVLLAAVRLVRRILGGAPPSPRPPVVEVVPPGWMSQEDGQVVDAGPRHVEAGGEPGTPDGGPAGAGERTLPPRG